jgi:hypothetical protein
MRAAVLALAAGCSGLIDSQAAKTTYRILEASQVAARRLPDVELAAAAMPGGLVQLDAFALAYPKHGGFRLLHTEALCQYAVGFVFDDWEDAQLGGRDDDAAQIATRLGTLLDSCMQANLSRLPAAWRTASRAAWLALLPEARVEHAPALLWIASAEGVRIAIDPVRGLARLPVTMATLERVIALAPGAHDADAELLLGSLRAATYRLRGGPDGAGLFAAARRALGEGALLVDVLEARAIAVARADRAAFTAQLERVLAADVTRWPERRLANELARRKARRYLAAIDALVPPMPSP